MKKDSTQIIGDVLKNVVKELDQTKKKDIAKLFSTWPSIVGKGLSRHTSPARLRQGTLLITVDDSAWFYQASLQKEKLLRALKKKIGGGKIQEIQFRMGKT